MTLYIKNYEINKHAEPQLGDIKCIKKFIWFPKKLKYISINGTIYQTRWLGFETIEYRYKITWKIDSFGIRSYTCKEWVAEYWK